MALLLVLGFAAGCGGEDSGGMSEEDVERVKSGPGEMPPEAKEAMGKAGGPPPGKIPGKNEGS
jgi:hypothetical protein